MISKINKTISACLAGCAISAVTASCGDFLEIESPNEITLEQFWNEKADVDAVVAGCYSRMQYSDIVRRMMVWGEFRSDNIAISPMLANNDENLKKVLNENLDASNAYTAWDGFYNIINRCNTVMRYAPDVAAKDPAFTQTELQATIAEVTALRDLCYFYLIRTFRDVPLMTEAIIDDDQEIAVAATPFDQVLDFLILERVKGDAIKKYPTTKKNYQRGRITQDAIKAMLCDMYLWKGDYQQCIRYADEIIESKKNDQQSDRSLSSMLVSAADNVKRLNGYPLVTDVLMSNYYGNAYSSIFGSGDSPETIFELVFEKGSGTSRLSNEAVNAFYGYANTQGWVQPSSVLTETSSTPYKNKYDARGWENLSTSAEIIQKYVYDNIRLYAADTNNDPTMSTRYSSYARDQNKSNWVIYRLSDIMLMKAEALAELTREGTDEATVAYNKPYLEQAFSLVSAINKRSLAETPMVDTLKPASYMTKTAMTKLVMEERHRELMFEGKRYYDLVRQARRSGESTQLATTVSAKQSSGGGYVRNKLSKIDAIYWPYNLDELKVNPNLKQNPAFGSGENQSYSKN